MDNLRTVTPTEDRPESLPDNAAPNADPADTPAEIAAPAAADQYMEWAESSHISAPQLVVEPEAAASQPQSQSLTAPLSVSAISDVESHQRRMMPSNKVILITVVSLLVFVVGLSAVVAAAFSGKKRMELGFGGGRSNESAADTTKVWVNDSGFEIPFTDTVSFADYYTKATAYPVTIPLPATGTPVLDQTPLITVTAGTRPIVLLAAPTVAPLPTGTVYALPTGALPLPLQHETENNFCADQSNTIGLGPCTPFLLAMEITAKDYGYSLTTFPAMFDAVLLQYPVGTRPWSGTTSETAEHVFSGTVGKSCQTHKEWKVWFGVYGEVWLHLTETLTKTCLIEKDGGEKFTIQPNFCECSWSGTLPV